MVAGNHLLMRMQALPPTALATSLDARLNDPCFLSHFDRTQILGTGDEDVGLSGQPHYGHTGCVNALGWSADGTMLVSGSDDFRLCLWKLGHEDGNSESMRTTTGNRRGAVYLGLGLQSTIHSGHRRNIFSAKFAPHAQNRIFSCAGDSQVRVFEVERATSSTYARGANGRAWTEYGESSGACIRVFRCHSDRAKRIALEGSPDVFLTCAEDGTVRQHDLRQSHACTPQTRGRICPTPLADYSDRSMGLYTLCGLSYTGVSFVSDDLTTHSTVSQARPEIFVVAGTSPYAFLHDRRMSRRSMYEQWGQVMRPEQPTQCVRRFGLPASEPQENEDTSSPAYRRRLLSQDKHVTATKLSNRNGRDLLVSYSGEAIYRYDILGDPELDGVVPPVMSPRPTTAKRKHSSPGDPNEQVRKRYETAKADAPRTPVNSAPDISHPLSSASTATTEETFVLTNSEKLLRKRVIRCLGLSRARRSTATAVPDGDPVEALAALDAMHDTMQLNATSLACRHLAFAMMRVPEPEDFETLRSTARTMVEADGWLPPRSRRRTGGGQQVGYEVSIGDDGELQISYGEASEDEEGSFEEGSTDEEADGDQPMYMPIEGAMASQEEANEAEEDEQVEMEEDEESDSADERYLARVEALRKREAGVNADVPVVLPIAKYDGHRNVDTVKDVNFGLGDEHIVSGSDDGRWFSWNKRSGELEGIWTGDSSVVNVIKGHPHLPVFAVSGIDDTIKIFAPTSADKKRFSCMNEAESIISKNRDSRTRGRGLLAPSAQMLLQLLSERMADSDDEGGPGPRQIRVDGQDCVIS